MNSLKKFGFAFLMFIVVSVFFWEVPILSNDRNEELEITLQDGGVSKSFRVKRGYLSPEAVEPAQSLIVLFVNYPDMSVPPIWKQGEPRREVQISIQAGTDRITQGEYLQQQWKERGHLPNNGPGFARYLGNKEGYDVYETLPNSKTGHIRQTLVFRDHGGNLTADGNRAEARMLGDFVVKYDSAKNMNIEPREMRIWVENFIRKIAVPPMEQLNYESLNKASGK